MAEPAIVLCAPVRTAIGTYKGALKDIPAPELGAVVVAETLKRAKLDAGQVESVAMGQVIQAGSKMNPARQAAVKGGVTDAASFAAPAHETRERSAAE